MDTTKLLKAYADFVEGVTSSASKNDEEFIARLQELSNQGLNISRLDTASDGLSGEAGEIKDIVKKIKFHGKPWTDELQAKLVDESGDILWYWMNLCIAINLDPVESFLRNIKKLQTRYPGGKFSVERSENRIV